MRASSVVPPTGRGTVWIRPASGLASINWTSRTSVAPDITLSASSTTK